MNGPFFDPYSCFMPPGFAGANGPFPVGPMQTFDPFSFMPTNGSAGFDASMARYLMGNGGVPQPSFNFSFLNNNGNTGFVPPWLGQGNIGPTGPNGFGPNGFMASGPNPFFSGQGYSAYRDPFASLTQSLRTPSYNNPNMPWTQNGSQQQGSNPFASLTNPVTQTDMPAPQGFTKLKAIDIDGDGKPDNMFVASHDMQGIKKGEVVMPSLTNPSALTPQMQQIFTSTTASSDYNRDGIPDPLIILGQMSVRLVSNQANQARFSGAFGDGIYVSNATMDFNGDRVADPRAMKFSADGNLTSQVVITQFAQDEAKRTEVEKMLAKAVAEIDAGTHDKDHVFESDRFKFKIAKHEKGADKTSVYVEIIAIKAAPTAAEKTADTKAKQDAATTTAGAEKKAGEKSATTTGK